MVDRPVEVLKEIEIIKNIPYEVIKEIEIPVYVDRIQERLV